MTLLSAGYWHTTFFAENFYNPDYWLHYGTAVAAVGGYYPRERLGWPTKKEPFLSREILEALFIYLQLKQQMR